MAALPKPALKNWDETSLTLETDGISWDPAVEQLSLQFKEPPVDWASASSVVIEPDGAVKQQIEIINLKPGTPYIVRLRLHKGGIDMYGPEAVFDTLPVDCTPRRKKKCIIM